MIRVLSAVLLAHFLAPGAPASAAQPEDGEQLLAHWRGRGHGWRGYGRGYGGRRHDRRRDDSSSASTPAETADTDSGYSGGGPDFSNIDWGKVTYNGLKMAGTCGNPLCFTVQGATALAVGPVFDVPYYALKPPIFILKCLGKGALFVGRAVAKPFRSGDARASE